MKRITLLILVALIIPSLSPTTAPAFAPEQPTEAFSFAVAADTRNYAGSGAYDTPDYLRGVTQAIAAAGPTAFLLAPGDIDPPAGIDWTLAETLGPAYHWFPVIGNHEIETAADMTWLRAYDYTAGGQFDVNPGPSGCPETTYSFDYANVHFVALNEYCDTAGDTVTDGDVPDHLYQWLAADLAANDQPHVFVAGHEPAFPLPDTDNGRLRHLGDSLDANPARRDRFWSLLAQAGVTAYLTGHTHNYSAARLAGVWQLDAGHARGLGDPGADSTFLLIHVDGEQVKFETYRRNAANGAYVRRYHGMLAGPWVHLPLVTSPSN